jgi:hypothetical protein
VESPVSKSRPGAPIAFGDHSKNLHKNQKWGKRGLKRLGKPYIVEPLQELAVWGFRLRFRRLA